MFHPLAAPKRRRRRDDGAEDEDGGAEEDEGAVYSALPSLWGAPRANSLRAAPLQPSSGCGPVLGGHRSVVRVRVGMGAKWVPLWHSAPGPDTCETLCVERPSDMSFIWRGYFR